MTGAARVWVTVAAVVAGLATVALVLVAVLVDLDTADKTASIVGAVLALASLVVSLIALFRDGNGNTPSPGRTVQGGEDSVVALGNITGSALGKNSKVTGPPTATPPHPAPAPQGGDNIRTERGGVVSLGDITDSALGEGSER